VTDGEQPLTKFQIKLRERKEREAATKAAEPKADVFDPELVPADEFKLTQEDIDFDKAVDGIDIIDAYRRWCGKMEPDVKGNQRESIKISCPKPDHKDSNPSAWLNLDKQVWFCGGCQEGGDAHDIAAWHFGYQVPDYKNGSQFHELRVKMAEDFGYKLTRMPGGAIEVTAPIVIEEEPDPVDRTQVAVVEDLYDDSDINLIMPTLDWRPLVPQDTFLDAYMKATIVDDVPEEYHFFHALLAIGFALGRDVRLADLIPVHANLFICTLGRSGAGKSKARYHLDQLLLKALPHDWTDPNSKGVRKIQSPGSAEVLIHNFQKPVTDPADPKKVLYMAPVRGLIDFNEFSSLIGRSGRQGSVLSPTLMQFYDMEKTVTTSSMTHGAKIAESPYASALTTTQPKALKTMFAKSDDNSGFLNRWLFIPGGEKERFAIGGARVDIDPAVAPLERILGWAGSFRGDEFIEWSPEAAQLFTSFFHGRIEPDKKTSEHDLIVRIDLLMKKIILLFSANLHQRLVTKECVEAAIACYQYFYDSYQIPAGQLGNTLTNEVSEAILHQARLAHARGQGITISELAKRLKRRNYPNKMLLDTVDVLVKLGYLNLEQTRSGSIGRPTTRYKYVD
jgi:hypothetical protein